MAVVGPNEDRRVGTGQTRQSSLRTIQTHMVLLFRPQPPWTGLGT